jgi:hypothetical protein
MEFVESELDVDGNNEFLHLYAMVSRMSTLDADENVDAEAITAKFISAQNRLKSKLDVVDGHEGAKRDFQELVANGYATIAAFYGKTKSQESLLKAIEFFEKASDVFKTMDTTEGRFGQIAIDKIISQIHSELSGNVVDGETSDGKKHYDVKIHKEKYQLSIVQYGESDTITIDMGVEFAFALYEKEMRAIEAERLLRKLLDISRLTHGPDHGCTKNVLGALQRVTSRLVLVALPDIVGLFQALRYENDWEECVVQGPFSDPRQIEEEEEYTMDSIDIIPIVGTTVICHSLQKASHLNGKIGEVRDFDVKEKEDGRKGFDKDIDRCVVHFEDEGLKPVSVKANNLRVVFDLPNLDYD